MVKVAVAEEAAAVATWEEEAAATWAGHRRAWVVCKGEALHQDFAAAAPR
jgi:hypothetical protein